jgi:hypothetical protein
MPAPIRRGGAPAPDRTLLGSRSAAAPVRPLLLGRRAGSLLRVCLRGRQHAKQRCDERCDQREEACGTSAEPKSGGGRHRSGFGALRVPADLVLLASDDRPDGAPHSPGACSRRPGPGLSTLSSLVASRCAARDVLERVAARTAHDVLRPRWCEAYVALGLVDAAAVLGPMVAPVAEFSRNLRGPAKRFDLRF